MDYKVLLEKYMAHILFEESITYVNKIDEPFNRIGFSEEEQIELELMSIKVESEN